MVRVKILLWTVLALFPLTMEGQTRQVGGEFLYYSDADMSPKEAFAAAIENARVQALAKEFGTLIIQDIKQQESEVDGRVNNYFMLLSSAEVKGEWIEDLEKPKTEIVETMPDGMLVIKASVKGRAKPVGNEAADFEVLLLRNGTDKRFAGTDFVEGDKMYMFFKAPANGYMAAYLIDETQMVSCLLPHESSAGGQQQVDRNKEYVFFSK